MAYLTMSWIAPHFSSLMKAKAKDESVFLFDESLIREIKKYQLGMHMRVWSDNQYCKYVMLLSLMESFIIKKILKKML